MSYQQRVRCPICLTLIDWERAPLVALDPQTSTWVTLQRRGEDDLSWNAAMRSAYRSCSGQLGGSTSGAVAHYLPDRFGADGVTQLVVGMVGETASGKTHLMAAMVNSLVNGRLDERYGLIVEPLDLALHETYMRSNVRPLMDRSERLLPTRASDETEFTAGFLIRNERTDRTFALAFFDVAGETMMSGNASTAFFQAAGGLIFVIDPQSIRGLNRRLRNRHGAFAAQLDDGVDAEGGTVGDRTFDRILDSLPESLRRQKGRYLEIPAAVVMGKADLFAVLDDRVYQWMYLQSGDDLDPDAELAEQEDVFVFVGAADGMAWLRPFERCIPSSLHFASATGGAIARDADVYPQRVRPQRVLRPLLSLFRMTGVMHVDQN